MATAGLPGADFGSSDTSTYVRAVQCWFRLFTPPPPGCEVEPGPNRATPRYLSAFLVFLRRMTDKAQEQRDRAGGGSIRWALWDGQMKRWRARLDAYQAAVLAAVGPETLDSHSVVLDNVTAPLLLGHYPGETEQRALDAVTPLSLAHQADVIEADFQAAWTKLGHDLAHNAQVAAGPFGGALVGIAGGAVEWGTVAKWTAAALGLVALVGGSIFGIRYALHAPIKGARSKARPRPKPPKVVADG